MSQLLAHRVSSLLRSNWVAFGAKRTLTSAGHATGFMGTRPNATLADFLRARDSQITFSVTHGWSAFWRGRPWSAERRIGETSLAVGSSRFWIGWVTRHGDRCARSTCGG